MADRKLNEVTKVTDMAYVPVIMADGSIGQIAKSDLASVVAGILKPLVVYPNKSISDANDATTGIYNYDFNYTISNTGGNIGTLISIQSIDSRYIMQLNVFYGEGSDLYFRRKYNGQWSEWKAL